MINPAEILPHYFTIPLFEYHGEYLQTLHDPKRRPGYARSFVVLDLFHLNDLGISVNLENVPMDLEAQIDSYNQGAQQMGGYLFCVTGTEPEHRKLFDELIDELAPGPQGADDDVFDYWPSAMECLEMYARTMYSRTKVSHYKVMIGRIATLNKDVPEWDARSLITWSKP